MEDSLLALSAETSSAEEGEFLKRDDALVENPHPINTLDKNSPHVETSNFQENRQHPCTHPNLKHSNLEQTTIESPIVEHSNIDDAHLDHPCIKDKNLEDTEHESCNLENSNLNYLNLVHRRRLENIDSEVIEQSKEGQGVIEGLCGSKDLDALSTEKQHKYTSEPPIPNPTVLASAANSSGNALDSRSNTCDICLEQSFRYRLSCCSCKCCSLQCYQKHKETQDAETGKCATLLRSAVHPELPPKPFSEKLQEYSIAEEGFIEATASLTEQDKERLRSDPELQKWLADPNLRQLIKTVDQSPNRIHQLSCMIKKPKFNDFVFYLFDLITKPHETETRQGTE